MYIPAAFQETDVDVLHAFIARHSFAMLVSQQDGEPFATHLPLILDPKAGENGTLLGHMARANPQWRQANGQRVLAVFSGPHAYVSPTWYEAENVVPTWNYTAVHVYGTFVAIHEPTDMLEIVRRTADTYEAGMPSPWKMDANSEFNRKLIGAVVGFRIDISRIEGKFKLSQNQPPGRREKVVRALRESGHEDANAVADLMKAAIAKDAG